MTFRRILLSVLAFGALAVPHPDARAASPVKIENAWVRAPQPGQKTASAYLEMTSPRDAVLIAAASPASERVELHASSIEGGVMRMRALARLELPGGKTVKLAPGGMHLMLVNPKAPLKPGDKVPLVLSIQPAGATAGSSRVDVKVEAEVRPLSGSGAHHHRH